MRAPLAVAALALCCIAPAARGQSETALAPYETEYEGVVWRDSIALGAPTRGALVNGVQLPAEGESFFTWDFPLGTAPSRPWRRWGTDGTIRVLIRVIAEYRYANPDAPRVGIADISRPSGGPFGRRFGGLGHSSHQSGLDVDVLYPRLDGLEAAPRSPKQIARPLAQDLVNRFVAAGAQYAFIGHRTKLTGPRKVVQKLAYHDDHIHVRFRRGAG